MTGPIRQTRARRFWPAMAALTLLALAGCTTVDQSVVLATEPVIAIPVGDARTVSADDLAAAMVRAGFDRDGILRYGPEVERALATAGGAQIRQAKLVEALFAVHGDKLYVTSRIRGTFVMPLGKGTAAG
jgi:hypothetical protein